jgi:hypothetical protein
VLLAVLPSCAPVTVRQTTLRSTYDGLQADAVSTGILSQMTPQGLRMQGLQAAEDEP